MKPTYVMTGKVVSPNQVQLDEPLPLKGSKVRVTVEPIDERDTRTIQEVIAQIRIRQAERGHQAPSKRDVDSYLASERNGWE